MLIFANNGRWLSHSAADRPSCKYDCPFSLLLSLLNSSITLGKINKRPNKNKSINPSFSLSSRGTYSGHTQCFSVLTVVSLTPGITDPQDPLEMLASWHRNGPCVVILAMHPLRYFFALPALTNFPWKVPCELHIERVAAA